MKNLIAFLLLISSFSGVSQTRNWKTETSKDGKVTVKSEILKTDNGKHIYYIAETIGNIALEQAEKYLRNSSNHKQFLENTTTSKEVKQFSDNEWITYYYFDAPWPVPNSDAVLNFKLTRSENELIVSANAVPKAHEMTDVKRMNVYNINYHFKRLDESTTQLILTVDFIPTGSVPKWLLRGWFPKGPAGIATRLLDGISKELKTN